MLWASVLLDPHSPVFFVVYLFCQSSMKCMKVHTSPQLLLATSYRTILSLHSIVSCETINMMPVVNRLFRFKDRLKQKTPDTLDKLEIIPFRLTHKSSLSISWLLKLGSDKTAKQQIRLSITVIGLLTILRPSCGRGSRAPWHVLPIIHTH